MLFEARPNGTFRRPMIGSPAFIGVDFTKEWPLAPITLIDNIPILIVRGYGLGGAAESPDAYVEYCLSACAWRNTKFEMATPEKRKEAVEKLIRENVKKPEDADLLREQAG
jgi:hypothetical protein